MRKIICCLLSAIIILTLSAGCADSSVKRGDKLTIVTTAFPPYDFVRSVTGSSADISMLLCPGAEAHSYEPAPLDILKIQQCDVFVYIGGEGEVWADKLLDSFDTSDITIIRLFDFVDPLSEEGVMGASPDGHHHEDNDEEEEEFDEHIWTSPRNAIKCVEGITSALSEAYPQSAQLFSVNSKSCMDQLKTLDEKFTEMTENAPHNTILIGDRFPFRYLAEDYGLDYYAAFSGCSSESEPGVYTMAFLIDRLLYDDIDTVFYLEFSTKRLAEKLSSAAGAQMLPLHSCHNVTPEEFSSGITYIDLMYRNLENIREALY